MSTDYPPEFFKHKRTPTGFTPGEIKFFETQIPSEARKKWQQLAVKPFQTKDQFEAEFVRHIETTLARSIYNCDNVGAYFATSYSVRDRLIIAWNNTQRNIATQDPKRVYYLSLEFLMGRAMDNALLNINVKPIASEGVSELGFRLEDVLNVEPDAALGNGGLGRLAACYMDSLSTMEYPAWGYGIRYQYGIFKQKIVNGYQVEAPDYWLAFSNPWELPRYEIQIDIMYYGEDVKYTDDDGNIRHSWENGELVQAVAYDNPVPGFETGHTNNLRLWTCKPTREFDFEKFNEGDYSSAVKAQQEAETISAVLYPNDNFDSGKELRLKQQYFWVAASLNDIVRRFKKSRHPWKDFPDQVAIQLNDTHPTLAVVELMRILVDMEELEWDFAWNIVNRTFAYTNHTVMQEALEKWPVPLLEKLLPRHMSIIYDINLFFLQEVAEKFPGNTDILRNVSIIEEGIPKQVRMAYLAIIGSHKVNGVAAFHSNLLKTTLFKNFVKVYGSDKFINVTNGITPRRWLHQANPSLSSLIQSKLGGTDYLKHLTRLKELEKFTGDADFRSKWRHAKRSNKIRLAAMVWDKYGIKLDVDAIFDIHVKRIHEYKRQQLNAFGIIYRYLELKKLFAENKGKKDFKRPFPHVSIIGGKSAPGYYAAKTIIKLVNSIADVVNKDEEIEGLLKVVFIEDYNVSKAEIIIPASDISQHISTAGTEGSGTSNMKFVLNGGLLLGTVDGANIEIAQDVGDDNIFMFGHLENEVEGLRYQHNYGKAQLNPKLKVVFDEIRKGTFGDSSIYNVLLNAVEHLGDYYLVSDDFDMYLEAIKKVEKAYVDKEAWTIKSIRAVANMGFFSSDRAVKEYAEKIWNVETISFDN